jgi:hypothetical protein
MHLFNSLIEKKEHHVIDLFYDFTFEFDFNEETTEIEKLTNAFILKFKTEIQENLDQLNDTQKYIYLDQLKTVFSKELPGLNNYLHEHCVKSIVEKEFPEGKESESDNLQEILTNFNNKYKYVKADIANNTINIIESFPYIKYWQGVKSGIYEFVSFALENILSKNNNTVNANNLPVENNITKAEAAFFKLIERFDLRYFDTNSTVSFHSLIDKSLVNLKNEVIENITKFSNAERTYYLIRIKKRTIQLFSFGDEHPIEPITHSEVENLNINHLYLEGGQSDIVCKQKELLQFIESLQNVEIESNQPLQSLCSTTLFPGKERSLLTIKENIFGKSTKKQESDEVWLSRFINNDSKLEPIFPNSKGAGRKGDEFTEAKIWQAALIDIIKDKLKESGCIGTASKFYFITKWGIDKYDTFITNRSEKESFAKAKNQFQSLLQ